jgi:hypothetical protein
MTIPAKRARNTLRMFDLLGDEEAAIVSQPISLLVAAGSQSV